MLQSHSTATFIVAGVYSSHRAAAPHYWDLRHIRLAAGGLGVAVTKLCGGDHGVLSFKL